MSVHPSKGPTWPSYSKPCSTRRDMRSRHGSRPFAGKMRPRVTTRTEAGATFAESQPPRASVDARSAFTTRPGDQVGAGHAALADSVGDERRAGKLSGTKGTETLRARAISFSRRHAGIKLESFQLLIVVSGNPVDRAIFADPPSASMMSRAVCISHCYDKRSVDARA